MKIKLLLILCGLVFTSCASDDDSFGRFSQISVQIQEGNLLSKKPEESFQLTVNLSSPETLSTLEVFENGQSKRVIPIENVKNRTITLDFETFKSEAGTSKFISFLATDETGGFGNAEVEIKVLSTSLDYVSNEIILTHYHSDTTNFAWDLTKNDFATDSAKADIWMNSSFGNWNAGIKSLTPTKFMRTDKIAFDQAFEEQLFLLFDSTSVVSDSIVNLKPSDILIAKLRDSDSYSIIEILQISDTVGDNSEQIVLKYRKVQENSGQ